jgi:acyl carrier protein
MENEIREKVKFFLEKNISGRPVTNDELLFEAGAIDSLGHLKLIAFLEKEFIVTFAMDELDWERFATVETIARFVAEKKK